MRDLAAWIAIGSLALVVYSYAVYPIVLAAWAAWQQVRRDLQYLRGKQERRQAEPADPSSWPAVAVVIAAYNEEQHIAARVANLLALDYPPEKLRILVGSDGSRDRTADILRGINDPRLHAHIVTANRGKAAMLNDLRERVQESIVVFSDANTYFDSQARS
jgi:cellulose synthase/poly-beta-1,6-N-acetylglucosamine synthase-like glycosyltransferase